MARSVVLRIVGELGEPLAGANVTTEARGHAVDAAGRVSIVTNVPVMALVTAPDHITEPVVLTPEMADEQLVRLVRRLGPDGTPRIVLHFAGDTMMGRRYLEPTGPTEDLTGDGEVELGAPIVDPDDDATARAVVADVAPLFSLADVSSVNLETVVGTLPSSAAYRGKRFLLQSPPAIIAALDELGVDVATLGNNHSNDWQGAGVASTLRYLDEAGIAAPGAGRTDGEARAAATVEVYGVTIGYLSYTTVTGDFVNDSLPVAGSAAPDDADPDDAWQWEERPFGYGTAADPLPLPIGSYRAGDVWTWYRAAEAELDDAAAATAWSHAVDVYPELQDWVARRGHGGAAWYRSGEVAADVAALRDGGADLVVVQIHGGFQFAEAPSEFLAAAARASVDAGADAVVAHHPHVLQGFEWYDDRLIAYSLGNFVFDQDFLSTFPSAVLRTVFEGRQLIEARVYPVVIDGYRPVPVGGAGAERVLRMLDVRSASRLVAERISDGTIGTLLAPDQPDGVVTAGVAVEHGSGRLTVERPSRRITVTTGADGVVDLAPSTVLQATTTASTWFGRDLFGWGSLEDVAADGEASGGMHWAIDPSSDSVRLALDPTRGDGNWHLDLTTRDTFIADVVVRPVARVIPARHRVVDLTGSPLDGAADHSVRLDVRVDGDVAPFIRVDAYHFIDTDPTTDPESTLVRQMKVTIDVPADGNWHRVDVPIPPAALAPDGTGRVVNAAMVYIGTPAPLRGAATVSIDDVAVIEWQAVATLPRGVWYQVDAVRTAGPDTTVTLTAR
jgi:poly-gamma-glutamate capsule biosynthesis protein CapA/YwtB (metallophosphatase superfamily)